MLVMKYLSLHLKRVTCRDNDAGNIIKSWELALLERCIIFRLLKNFLFPMFPLEPATEWLTGIGRDRLSKGHCILINRCLLS